MENGKQRRREGWSAHLQNHQRSIEMELKEIKTLLADIGRTYPTVMGLMKKSCGEKEGGETLTVGEHWANTLKSAKLDDADLENVCVEFAELQLQMPDPCDRLPFEIRRVAMERAAARRKRFEQHVESCRNKMHKLTGDRTLFDDSRETVLRKWREFKADSQPSVACGQ